MNITLNLIILFFIISYIAVWGVMQYMMLLKLSLKVKTLKLYGQFLFFSFLLPQYFISFTKKSLFSCIFIQAKKFKSCNSISSLLNIY